MAHYRKLTVDGIDYRYVVSQSKTFVKGPNGDREFDNSVIGHEHHRAYIVTPGDIARAIKGEPLRVFHCKKHGVSTTKLVTDPFDIEIHNKVTLVMECPECQEQSWLDT